MTWMDNGIHLTPLLSTGRSIDNATILRNKFIQHDLNQRHPTLVNDKNYTLDLLFTNTKVLSSNVPDKVLSTIDSHHPPFV